MMGIAEILRRYEMKTTPIDYDKHFDKYKSIYTKPECDISFKMKDDSDMNLNQIAFSFFNKIYTQIPSMVDNAVYYDIKLLEFLSTNASCLLRKLSFGYLQFIYNYKNAIILVIQELDKNKLRITQYFKNSEVPFIFEEFVYDKANASSIGILKKNSYGDIEVDYIELKVSTTLDVDQYYNDDFAFFKDKFVEKLNKKEAGLYLLHGAPGTGKSEFCKHLIGDVAREFIFIPPAMVSCLSSPEFNELLTNAHKGAVLVIEDAEKALMKRTTEDGFHNSDLVSTILNLTDGIFADLTNVSIIATYNCDRNMIDEALLRKGRLKIEYEFKKLSVEKSQNLMDTLGFSVNVNEEMTLAEIFNYENQDTNNKKEEKRIGFGS